MPLMVGDGPKFMPPGNDGRTPAIEDIVASLLARAERMVGRRRASEIEAELATAAREIWEVLCAPLDPEDEP